MGVVRRIQPVTITTDCRPHGGLPRRRMRPEVSGVILKRLFIEGGEVKAGQQLYQIDPRVQAIWTRAGVAGARPASWTSAVAWCSAYNH